jgi:hypothetical protein
MQGRLGATRADTGIGYAMSNTGPRKQNTPKAYKPRSLTEMFDEALRAPKPEKPPEAPLPTEPIHPIRVLASGEFRIPKYTGVEYDEETNTLVLDSDTDGSIVVTGAGCMNVERRGAGNGDAVHEGGHGNVTRSGSGHGHAVRKSYTHGNATRTGTGDGNAMRLGRGYGNGTRVGAGRGTVTLEKDPWGKVTIENPEPAEPAA